jgi:hypothetical protein
MKNINIKHINSLHNDALTSLAFYEQELVILKGRLEEIASKNTGDEAEIGIEHFQNEFIIHGEKIDELKHALHEIQHQLEVQVVSTAGYAEEETLKQNEKLYEEYLEEEKLFNELRVEFLAFAVKWM